MVRTIAGVEISSRGRQARGDIEGASRFSFPGTSVDHR